ncbi:MAG: class I SAM-dependent methyltransferase [Hyphomonadaceae bacterium]
MDRAHFEDPEFVQRYAEGPGRFVPGYAVMQRMAAQLIAEKIGAEGDVLVLGAGGGLELEAFARAQPRWRYIAVDPAREMLSAARERMVAAGAERRVEWTEGYVFDAPSRQYDAATALLTLHFVADDGAKLETLQATRARLKPGAPFVLVDLCLDKASADYDRHLSRYRAFALESGAEAGDVADTVARVRNLINTVSPDRNVALLAAAGFAGVDLFFAGLSWRGWVSYA